MNTIMGILQLIFLILFVVQFFCHIVCKPTIYLILSLISLIMGILMICTNDIWWGIGTIVCAFIWIYAYYTIKNKIENILSKLS